MMAHASHSKPAYAVVNTSEVDSIPVKSPVRPQRLRSFFSGHPDHWQPFSLRPVGLISFAAVLTSLLIALLAIWLCAQNSQGFSLVTDNHYTWTYGPTIIFIVVISYWRLLDYHSKALQPWAELAKSSSFADRSLFSDYVSPLLPTTFSLASRRRNYAVCIGIAGFLVLKVVIIASTGLFLVEAVVVGPLERELQRTTQFDTTTNFSRTATPNAALIYEAYATMQLGLPLSDGLTHDMLYETYDTAWDNDNTNATYLVRSRAFAPQVQCEAADIKVLVDWDAFGVATEESKATLQIQNTSLWSCPGALNGGPVAKLSFTDVARYLAPPRQLLTSFGSSNCHLKDDSEMAASPYLVALSDIRTTQTFNVTTSNITLGDMLEPTTWDFEVKKITAMLCTVDYDMVEVDLLYNTSLTYNQAQSVSLAAASTPSKLPNLSTRYLTDELESAAVGLLSAARDMFGISTQFEYAEEAPHTVLTMVAEYAGTDYKGLLEEPQIFKEATEHVLNNMILHLVKNSAIIPQSNSSFVPQQALSQEHHPEGKLIMQPVAFGIVAGGMALLLFLTAAMQMLRPQASLTTNPESLLTQIAMLKSSDELNKALQRSASFTEKSARNAFGRSTYQRDIAGPSINVSPLHHVSEPEGTDDPKFNGPQDMYKPFTLSKAFLGLTLLSAPLTIAALECLQRFSDSGIPGIATIDTDDSFLHALYSRYLPALIALLIATFYNSLDCNTMILAPFNGLLSDHGSQDQLGTPLIAYIAPVAIWKALKRRYWPACLTGLAALVGSILTIIVSGLYTVEDIANPEQVSMFSGDSWNISYAQGFQSDHGATAVSSLLESSNLSYPRFTYNGMVFPTLGAKTGLEGSVALFTPALRAELSCKELPWETSNFTWSNFRNNPTASPGEPLVNFNIRVPLPDTCLFGSCHGNESFIDVTLDRVALNSDTNTTYYGQVVDLHTGPWRPNDSTCNIWFSPSGSVQTEQNVNQPGCPSLVIVYGHFDGSNLSKQTWTTLLCEQRLQQLNTSLILDLPAADIIPDPPPKADEDTATYIENGPNGEITFGWWLNTNLDYSHTLFNESAIDPVLETGGTVVSNSQPPFSNFFRAAFFGATPLPLATLQRNDTETKDLVFDHLNKFYRRYMAQWISTNLRVQESHMSLTNSSFSSSSPTTPLSTRQEDQDNNNNNIIITHEPVSGSLLTSTKRRLVQHNTPKIILQSMLAFMFACAVVALCTARYHDLVLWNPCTIAGVMVLFAGSKLCDPGRNSNFTADQPTQTGVRDDAGHEMTEISSSRATSGKTQTQTLLSTGSEVSLVQGQRARLRLGWWQHGVYMGQMREKGAVREGDGWRYGIDVM